MSTNINDLITCTVVFLAFPSRSDSVCCMCAEFLCLTMNTRTLKNIAIQTRLVFLAEYGATCGFVKCLCIYIVLALYFGITTDINVIFRLPDSFLFGDCLPGLVTRIGNLAVFPNKLQLF